MVATGPPPSADLITWLVSAGMLDEAVEEMKHAQRAHGRTPRLDATLAWVYRQQGEIRPAINTMRQAYPQYLSVEGDALPREYPGSDLPNQYVPLIKRYSALHDLDPFVVAALIGQESSYVADVRSPADAWGLMQILPGTGRQLARAEGVPRFRTQMLTDPETNVRLRHATLRRTLVRNLGGVPYALAGYNAGAARVIRWKAERGPLEQAEFIDDIPFPETQMYVKKILGNRGGLQRLYGHVLGRISARASRCGSRTRCRARTARRCVRADLASRPLATPQSRRGSDTLRERAGVDAACTATPCVDHPVRSSCCVRRGRCLR